VGRAHGEEVIVIESLFDGIDREVRGILEACLGGHEPTWQEGVVLSGVRGRAFQALAATADHLRQEQVGDVATYVVNRNVNFTNVCVKTCRFCAFSRAHRSEEAYWLPEEEIVRRALEAQAMGATELCLQAGMPPAMNGRLYVELVRALKAAAPALHLHAFSPEEIKYGADICRVPYRAYLEELRDAGLGSLPGTSAEILDDGVRAKIAPGRMSTAEWVDVVRAAHAVGLPTTSTIMFGHVETDAERMRHLDLLRSIQRETGGFTELVPLSFVHAEAPMFARAEIPGLRTGPTGHEVVRLFAIARLMVGRTIKNLQASWVKEGLRQAELLLSAGANDLGGTLMNESISTTAGSANGQLQGPAALRRAIRDAGRRPAERDTRYRLLKELPLEPGPEGEPLEPLDRVVDAEATFGSYRALAGDESVRFQLRRRGAEA
jgi:FO synthase subunit 2